MRRSLRLETSRPVTRTRRHVARPAGGSATDQVRRPRPRTSGRLQRPVRPPTPTVGGLERASADRLPWRKGPAPRAESARRPATRSGGPATTCAPRRTPLLGRRPRSSPTLSHDAPGSGPAGRARPGRANSPPVAARVVGSGGWACAISRRRRRPSGGRRTDVGEMAPPSPDGRRGERPGGTHSGSRHKGKWGRGDQDRPSPNHRRPAPGRR